MDKKWISTLAGDIEARHGKEARDKIFGNINGVENNPKSLSAWFDNFVTGMDALGDKEFLQKMMAKHCPCDWFDLKDGKQIKELYDKSKNLEEFVDLFNKWERDKYNNDVHTTKLLGNALYLIKPKIVNESGGSYGKGCACGLAMYTEKSISDIFCHCCTIGHTGGIFKAAFGDDLKMEFIESTICGGKECTMAVYLPEKHIAD